jgi:hypothetical protein
MPNRCTALASTDDGRTVTESPPPSNRLSEVVRQQMEGQQPKHCVAINTLNCQLTTCFPSNFIDPWFPNNFIDRAALAANANQTAMNQVDRAADIVPGSMRVDRQHPSSGGYRIDAQQVANSFVVSLSPCAAICLLPNTCLISAV